MHLRRSASGRACHSISASLKDFFRSYKDFTDRELDVIEIMVQKLYAKWGISDRSHFDRHELL